MSSPSKNSGPKTSGPKPAGHHRPRSHEQSPVGPVARPSAAKATNASAQAANAALEQLLDDRRRRRLYGPVVEQRRGLVGGAADEVFATANDLAARTGLPVRAIVALVLLAAFTGAAYWLIAPRLGRTAPGTTIAGKVLIDGKPLTQAALEFHATSQAAGDAAAMLRVETNHEGAFLRTAAVPAGTYAVVVKSGCVMPSPTAEIGRPVRIPAKYTSLSSTPIAVEFRKEPSSFRIVLRN